MAKRAPRLLFTEDELETPELKKPIQKAEKAQKKLEKAESKISKKKMIQKQRVYDPKENQVVTRLVFEETEKKRPSKLSHAVKAAPLNTVSVASHKAMSDGADDSAGASLSHDVISSAEGSIRTVDTAHRVLQDRPYARALKAERAADRANIKALYKEAEVQNGGWSVNPYSRFQQKRAIRKGYAEAKAGKTAGNTVKASETAAKAMQKSGETTSKVGQFIVRHKKGFVIVGIIGAMFLLCSSFLSSCSLMMSSISSPSVLSTYPSQDTDMLAAETQYLALEQELQDYLDTYEDNPKKNRNDSMTLHIVSYAIALELNEIKLIKENAALLDVSKYPENIVHVHLLGDLRIAARGGVLQSNPFSIQGHALFAMLLLNPGRQLSMEDIYDIISTTKESDNPAAVVTNALYKVRNCLDIIGLHELICTDHGRYYLNPKYQVETDVDRFQQFAAAMKTAEDESEKLRLGEEALSLYVNPLPPAICNDVRLVVEQAELECTFLDVAKECASIYMNRQEYGKALHIISNAMKNNPLETELMLYRIRLMKKSGSSGMKSYIHKIKPYLDENELKELQAILEDKE